MSRVQSLKRRPAAPAAVLTFTGTTACIVLAPALPVAAVLFDGHPLAADRWHSAADGALAIACPPTAFDAAPHVLRLDWQQAGVPPTELAFRSDYRGAIDRADDALLCGWLYDTLRPGSPLTLEVAGAAAAVQAPNTLKLPATAPEIAGLVGGGFAITLPPRPADSRPELLSLTVQGTGHRPFAPILRGASLPALVAAATAAGRALGPSPEGVLFATVLLPAITAALCDHGPGVGRHLIRGAVRLPGGRFLPGATAPRIDVVVPAYRGVKETLACLASVLDGGSRIAHRIVVIDDCSPEPELSAALQALAREGRIHYVRNAANQGFVASANAGMALSDAADVLLLNADTIAPPGFLDRLHRAAYADQAIATVTPLSNNATVYSLPAPPGQAGDPWDLPVAAIDALCQEANAGAVRDIPTAHGFCMFIKRAAIADVGPFDAARFGTGYGEENDFSLRAQARGWRNVCAADVYVGHLGAVSFAASPERDAQLAANLREVQTRFPFYAAAVADFIRTDPLHDLRNNVQKAVWRARQERIAVVVTLALAGGAVRHSGDLMARLTAEGWLALALTAGSDADGRPVLTLRRWASEEALRYPATAPQEGVLADILDLGPRFLHVQHLIDLPDGIAEFVRDCGIPYAVTLHDFFYACPKVTLLDAGAQYCGMPPAARCTACVRQGPIHPQVHPSLAGYAEAGETWRGKWAGLLREAAQVIAPSADTAARYATLFPGLVASVRPHFAPPDLPAPAAAVAASGPGLRVALPGALGPQKGVRALIELARHCSRWHDDIGFVLVGYSDREEALKLHDNIERRGGYAPAGAVAALAAAGCRVALLLNVFPETFSYTLSESLQAGLVPVAYDFGAIGERMRALRVGVLVPPGAPPETLVAALREAAAMAVALPPVALYGQYGALMADYYAPALADLAAVIPPPETPRLLGAPRGLHADRWCEAVVSLRIWSARRLTRLALSLWVPEEGRAQAVEISCNGVRLTQATLDASDTNRLVCALPAAGPRLLEIRCRFDFVFRLQPPDIRACAAMLARAQVSEGTGWLDLDMPPPPA